jgi:hypothetical protein
MSERKDGIWFGLGDRAAHHPGGGRQYSLEFCLRRYDRCCLANYSGEKFMNKRLLANAIFLAFVTLGTAAEARTSYDGPWNLVFSTQRGSCDPTYTFAVNVTDGIVSHPNLVKFRGYVAKSGVVRASVTVHDKYASGSGRLTGDSGRGTWIGHAGSERCSGYWTAQRGQ